MADHLLQTGDYGFKYIPDVLGQLRDSYDHERSKARHEDDKKFLEMVMTSHLLGRDQTSAQQAYRVAASSDAFPNNTTAFPDPNVPETPSYPAGSSPDDLTNCRYEDNYPAPESEITSAMQASEPSVGQFNFVSSALYDGKGPLSYRANSFQVTQDGAHSEHQSTNIASERSTAVDSGYGSKEGQEYGQDHMSGQDYLSVGLQPGKGVYPPRTVPGYITEGEPTDLDNLTGLFRSISKQGDVEWEDEYDAYGGPHDYAQE